ncbi:MAG TPA: hypothetical protein VJT50_05230 [Pyrinomonadaceae bacterium]|nr:hypothetical protein [Pyrinomonadaceae bacterium]
MKKMNRWLKMGSVTIALVLGFAIGLGLAVHELFLLVLLIMLLVLVGEWTARKAHEYLRHFHPRP